MLAIKFFIGKFFLLFNVYFYGLLKGIIINGFIKGFMLGGGYIIKQAFHY